MICITRQTDINITQAQMNLIFRARSLWRDMVIWLRAYIVSVYEDIGSQELIAERINRIPSDYRNIYITFFGDKIADDYQNLVANYLRIFQLFVNAQKNGNDEQVNEYINQLYESINQRAAYLSQINPFWTESQWKVLLDTMNNMLIDEATTFQTRDHKRNIEVFDSLLNHTSIMGDYMSEGIMNYLQYRR